MEDNLNETPQNRRKPKRTDTVLSPPKQSDLKKNKMVDNVPEPQKPGWAQDFATAGHIDQFFKKFKEEVFKPLKEQLLGHMDLLQTDMKSAKDSLKDITNKKRSSIGLSISRVAKSRT